MYFNLFLILYKDFLFEIMFEETIKSNEIWIKEDLLI